MQNLRLIDSDGYTVPGGIRTNVPDDQADTVRAHLLTEVAPDYAAQWADFGHDARLYTVTTD